MSSTAARHAREKLAKKEGLASFTTCLQERPLDVKYRRLVRAALKSKAKKR